MGLDLVSVLLSAISVVQSWRRGNGNTGDVNREAFLEYLNQLRKLDDVFNAAKKIHDAVDSFQRSVANTEKELCGDLNQISRNQQADHFDLYKNYMDVMIEKFPQATLVPLDGDVEEFVSDAPMTSHIKESLSRLYSNYSAVLENHAKTIEASESLKRIDFENESGELVKTEIGELKNPVANLYTHADKVILYCADIMSLLHTEASSSLRG